MAPDPPRVVLDACVIYPMPLCDTLLRAAHAGLLQPCWSAEILDEVTRNLVADGRATPELARRRRALIEEHFPEAMITGYEALVDEMPNHPKDRHVAAAAITAEASAIVTYNLGDFRRLPGTLEALHPDILLCELLDRDARAVVRVIEAQAAALHRPAATTAAILDRLARDVPRFVARMRRRS